jgi:predicted DsbA family dithiol-disulfide isomerase
MMLNCASLTRSEFQETMNVSVTYFLDVTSSWCYWAEPAWSELKERYARQPVEFSWKIALLDTSSLPASKAQEEWFYRRSGTVVRSPFMLNAGWFDSSLKEYLAPNCAVEAAKHFGITDDRARLALAHAAVREGQRVGDWEIVADVAAKASGLNARELLAKARSAEIEKIVRETTAEFHALQVTQRPTFTLKSNIDDRAVFSGLVKAQPIAETIDAMLADAAAYASYAAHFGAPPAS